MISRIERRTIAKKVTKLIAWYIDKNGVQFDLNFGFADLMDLYYLKQ
jgi:hypothetical protein